MKKISASLLAGILGVAVSGLAAAQAQDYPTRPIRFIVADSPGTNSDLLGRVLGASMSTMLGQQVVVENRPGASYRIGWEYAAKQAAPDGYTIVLGNIPGMVSLPLISKDLRFDPLKDLPPIMGLVEGRLTLSSPASAPWNTFNEMIATARANPGKLNFGSSGIISRLPMEVVNKTFGVNIVFVPYKAGNTFLQGLVTGEVQVGGIGESSAIAFGNRVKVITISGSNRAVNYPNVPTFTEVGLPPVVGNYFTMNAPVDFPKAAAEKLYAVGSKALQQSEVKTMLEKFKFEIVPGSPEAAAKSLQEQAKIYADIARQVGIQPE